MFELYTDEAKRVIFFADYSAHRVNSKWIEPEDILHGIVAHSEAAASGLFHLDEHAGELLNLLEQRRRLTPGNHEPHRPLSPSGQRVLRYAAQEQRLRGDLHIGSEHLLIGIVREGKSVAASVLTERGFSVASLRAQLPQCDYESGYKRESVGLARSLTPLQWFILLILAWLGLNFFLAIVR